MFVLPLLKLEGAGKTGCALHPRSRVRFAQRKRTRAYRFSGNTPAFPAQWLYGLLRALPGERLFCHRRPRITSAQLDASTAASGPHDFAVRVTPRSSSRASRVHRISPHVRDDRERPSSAVRRAELMPLICPTSESRIFLRRRAGQILEIRSDLPVGLICRSYASCACACSARSVAHVRIRMVIAISEHIHSADCVDRRLRSSQAGTWCAVTTDLTTHRCTAASSSCARPASAPSAGPT